MARAPHAASLFSEIGDLIATERIGTSSSTNRQACKTWRQSTGWPGSDGCRGREPDPAENLPKRAWAQIRAPLWLSARRRKDSRHCKGLISQGPTPHQKNHDMGRCDNRYDFRRPIGHFFHRSNWFDAFYDDKLYGRNAPTGW